MSTGDVDPGQSNSSVKPRSWVRLIAVAVPVAIGLFFFVGGPAYELRKRYVDRQELQEETTSRIDQAERQTQQQRAQLDAEERLLADQELLDGETFQDVKNRLAKIEESLRQNLDQATKLTGEAGEIEGERARNRARLIEAYDIGQRVASGLKKLDSETTKWTVAVSALTSDDDETGKRIAGRPDLVQQFSALTSAKMTTVEEIESWRKQFQVVYSRIEAAYENPDRHVVVVQDDVEFLTGLEKRVGAARDQLRQHQRVLNVIEATAARLDPGQLSLKQALEQLQASRDEAFRLKVAEAEEAAIRKVDEQYAAKLAEERRKQRELLKQQELEAERIAAGEREKELAAIKKRRKALEDKIAAEKLEAEYRRELPTIKSLLAPFLDNAITQPVRGNPIGKGGPMRPTSLGALRGSGALENTNKGLDFLFRVGGHPANMRDKGSFPTFVSQRPLGSGAEREQVSKAQQLLIKYGDLLVRDGLLSE